MKKTDADIAAAIDRQSWNDDDEPDGELLTDGEFDPEKIREMLGA